MTVSSTTSRVSYAGNGVTTAFSFPHLFLANSDLVVTLVVDSTGAETVQTITTNYTVTGAGNPAGGTVTMIVAPASGETLVIERVMSLTQPVDYQSLDPFPAETHEQALDRLTLISQQINTSIERSLRLAVGDPTTTLGTLPNKAARANQFLAFNADGDPMASAGPTSGVPVTAFAATLLDDTTAAAMRTTLGLGTMALEDVGDVDNILVMDSQPINEAQGANIASAATTDIGAATGNYVEVTGTVTITGLGTVQAGTRRIVRFTGILTLTHNATSLILPTGANITTAANDVAVFVSLGSGNWICVNYMRADGSSLGGSTTGWELIERKAITSSSTIDFTTGITSTYDAFRIRIFNLQIDTDDGEIGLRVSNDGGSSWQTGAMDYKTWYDSGDPATGSLQQATNGADEIKLSRNSGTRDLGNAAGESYSADILIYGAPDSGLFTNVRAAFVYDEALNQVMGGHAIGRYETAETIDGFQIVNDNSGTFDGGILVLEGYRST